MNGSSRLHATIDVDALGNDDPIWRSSLEFWLSRKGLDLDEAAVSTLLARSIKLRLGTGDFVFLQGASASHLYVLVLGLVHIHRREADLAEVPRDAAAKLLRENPGNLIATLLPGESFGQLALSFARARNTTARCDRPSLLIKIPRGCPPPRGAGRGRGARGAGRGARGAGRQGLLGAAGRPLARIEAGREDFLRALPLLRGHDDGLLATLAKLARSQAFARHAVIARPGEAAERVHFVVSGECEVHEVVSFKEGAGEASLRLKEVPITSVGPGACIGGLEAAAEAPYGERYVATTALTTLHFSAADFLRHIARAEEAREALERLRAARAAVREARGHSLRRDLAAIAPSSTPRPSPRAALRPPPHPGAPRRAQRGPEMPPLPRPPPAAPLVQEAEQGGAGGGLPRAPSPPSRPRPRAPAPVATPREEARPEWAPLPPRAPQAASGPGGAVLDPSRFLMGRGAPSRTSSSSTASAPPARGPRPPGPASRPAQLALGDKIGAEERVLRAAALRIGAAGEAPFLPREATRAASEGRARGPGHRRAQSEGQGGGLARGAVQDLRGVTGLAPASDPSLFADRGAAGLLSPRHLRPVRLLSRQKK
eukprot:tig00001376_g8539.t1